MAQDSVADIFQKVDKFTRELYDVMAEDDSNLYISPFCLHAILVMIYEGSCGRTRTEFDNCLKLNNPQIDIDAYKEIFNKLENLEQCELHAIRKLYLPEKYNVNEVYSLFVDEFSAEIEQVNYENNVETSQTINTWFATESNNKILNISNPEDFHHLSNMVLITATCFKAQWLYKFNLDSTRIETFRITETSNVDCQMMIVTGYIPYAKNKELNADILRLPFTNNSFSLLILSSRTVNDTPHLEGQLQHVSFTEMIETLDSSRKLNVYLPKFTMEQQNDLTNKLRAMGFWRSYNTNAQFDNIVEGEHVHISKILQKATIGINEFGIDSSLIEAPFPFEAAPPENMAIPLRINHQFLYVLIYEFQGKYCPLSIGKVYSP